MSRVRIPSSTPFLSSNHHFSYTMKHGDFLCFVTRIVEKSWKNYATCRAQKEPFSTDLPRKTLFVEDDVPADTCGDMPLQAWVHPRTIATEWHTQRAVSSNEPMFFTFFASNRGKSWKTGRLHPSMQPARHSYGQLTCDTAFRASLQLSVEALSPTAAAGTSARTAPQRNRIPREPRLRVRHAHVERWDNRVPQR